MYSSFGSLLSVGFSLVQGLVPLFGVIFIASKVTGTARILGMVGCMLLALGGLVQTAIFLLLPRIAPALEGVGFVAVAYVFTNLVSLVGLTLVIAAVCTGRATTSPSASFPR